MRQHPGIQNRIVQRAVKRPHLVPGRKFQIDAAQQLPVPHVRGHQGKSRTTRQRGFQNLLIFNRHNPVDLLKRQVRRVHRGQQIRRSPAEGLARHLPQGRQVMLPMESNAQVSQDHPLAERHEVPGDPAKRLADAENHRPREQTHEFLNRRLGQPLDPPLPELGLIF